MTEWELSLARQLRKPLAIYWISGSSKPDAAQDSLHQLLEEADDLRIETVSLHGLRRAVRRDLDEWAAGGHNPPLFFASRLTHRTPQSHLGARPIDVDEAQGRLAVVRSLRDRELYLDAERELNYLRLMIRHFASPRAARGQLLALRDFLDLAANVNHVRGRHDAARANAVAAIQVGWHLPDPEGRLLSASAASGIYSRDRSGVALAANSYARDRATDPVQLAGILDSRAAILLNRGDVNTAAKLMREAVVLHERADNVLGYLHARLGTTLGATKQRREWEAVDESFAAAAPLVSRHSLSRVMLYAARIPHLIEAHHDSAQAVALFNRAVRDCRRFGLTDPLLGLARLSARYGLSDTEQSARHIPDKPRKSSGRRSNVTGGASA